MPYRLFQPSAEQDRVRPVGCDEGESTAAEQRRNHGGEHLAQSETQREDDDRDGHRLGDDGQAGPDEPRKSEHECAAAREQQDLPRLEGPIARRSRRRDEHVEVEAI